MKIRATFKTIKMLLTGERDETVNENVDERSASGPWVPNQAGGYTTLGYRMPPGHPLWAKHLSAGTRTGHGAKSLICLLEHWGVLPHGHWAGPSVDLGN